MVDSCSFLFVIIPFLHFLLVFLTLFFIFFYFFFSFSSPFFLFSLFFTPKKPFDFQLNFVVLFSFLLVIYGPKLYLSTIIPVYLSASLCRPVMPMMIPLITTMIHFFSLHHHPPPPPPLQNVVDLFLRKLQCQSVGRVYGHGTTQIVCPNRVEYDRVQTDAKLPGNVQCSIRFVRAATG